MKQTNSTVTQTWWKPSLGKLAPSLDLALMFGVELEFYSRESYDHLQKLIENNFPLIHALKKEDGQSQYEIVTAPTTDFQSLARQINFFKEMTCDINNFSAKPFLDRPGSAIHVHISLHDKDSMLNVLNIEPKIKFFVIGGLCHYIRSSMMHFAPTMASYRRFQYYDKFTPRFANWGFEDNKTNAIRVTKNTIEHRVPCADANLEKVILEIISAISRGIEEKIMPSKPNFGEPKYSESFQKRIPLSYRESQYYF